jgi:hypothetical protein
MAQSPGGLEENSNCNQERVIRCQKVVAEVKP